MGASRGARRGSVSWGSTVMQGCQQDQAQARSKDSHRFTWAAQGRLAGRGCVPQETLGAGWADGCAQ